jgi:hypothetical protein
MREKYTFLQFKYETFEELAKQDLAGLFGKDKADSSKSLDANILASIFIENLGDGKFKYKELPRRAQFSALKGTICLDVNSDGYLDVLLEGNNYGMAPNFNRQDANQGLLLLGDGKGNFKQELSHQSGYFNNKDSRSLGLVKANDNMFTISTNNNDVLAIHEIKNCQTYQLPQDARSCIVTFRDGTIQKTEVYKGSSFLTQSPAFIVLTPLVNYITLELDNGKTKVIEF